MTCYLNVNFNDKQSYNIELADNANAYLVTDEKTRTKFYVSKSHIVKFFSQIYENEIHHTGVGFLYELILYFLQNGEEVCVLFQLEKDVLGKKKTFLKTFARFIELRDNIYDANQMHN